MDGAVFHLNIHADSAAFEDDPTPELARILRRVADTIEAGTDISQYQTILDVNGNDVGRFALKPEWYR